MLTKHNLTVNSFSTFISDVREGVSDIFSSLELVEMMVPTSPLKKDKKDQKWSRSFIKNISYFLLQCFPKSGPHTIFGPHKFFMWSAKNKIALLLR